MKKVSLLSKESVIIPLSSSIELIFGKDFQSFSIFFFKFFYEDIGKKFKYVIRIPGNHEFYKGNINYIYYPQYKKEFLKNHYKLNNQTHIINGVKFIASILWSIIPDEEREKYYQIMNDYRYININYQPWLNSPSDNLKLRIDDTNLFHQISRDFIEKELKKEYNGKIVVVTHHLPSLEFIKNPSKLEYKYSYGTSLDSIIKNNFFDLWIFGHRHRSFDISFQGKRFVSNPLGYLDGAQKDNFKRDIYIEI